MWYCRESGVTNEGFRRVECCSNGLVLVEEDRREEREQEDTY